MASPFADHPGSLSGTPVAMDAHQDWPRYPAAAEAAPLPVVASAQAGLRGPPAAPLAVEISKKWEFKSGERPPCSAEELEFRQQSSGWRSPRANPTRLLPSHDKNALSLSAGLTMEAAHLRS
ncbi:hypothetical protein T492DRAFT_841924 [Pavlovales sp. CCMP2436]|nr:hypothetical protein T492DRAFT_841924 [Pavlovales sp. CCMP2436]